VRVLEGPGGRGAILPRLRAQVVVETRASRHGLGVEIGREGAILNIKDMVRNFARFNEFQKDRKNIAEKRRLTLPQAPRTERIEHRINMKDQSLQQLKHRNILGKTEHRHRGGRNAATGIGE
jgi:hypothetical protein